MPASGYHNSVIPREDVANLDGEFIPVSQTGIITYGDVDYVQPQGRITIVDD